jgi:glycosyltransferase involved in cell wall biosynthesis
MDISVVIPLYNEQESLEQGQLLAEIAEVMQSLQLSYEVIMVDDGSNDRSWELISQLQMRYPSVRGIRFQRNYGKSAALHVGFQAALGEVVITMDADGQDNPIEIPELYRLIKEEGYDLISGWKKKRYDPLSKTIPSKFFNALTRRVSGIKNLHDFNCGLKSYRRDVVKSIEVYGEMHRYIPLLAKYAGFRKIGEKVVEHRAREFGQSKFGGLDRGIKGLLDLISVVLTQKYFKRPLHFFGLWGILFLLVGGLSLLYLLGIKLITGEGISHRMPAMFFGSTTLLLGMMLFAVGLLGELIGRNSSIRNEYRIREEVGGELTDERR